MNLTKIWRICQALVTCCPFVSSIPLCSIRLWRIHHSLESPDSKVWPWKPPTISTIAIHRQWCSNCFHLFVSYRSLNLRLLEEGPGKRTKASGWWTKLTVFQHFMSCLCLYTYMTYMCLSISCLILESQRNFWCLYWWHLLSEHTPHHDIFGYTTMYPMLQALGTFSNTIHLGCHGCLHHKGVQW